MRRLGVTQEQLDQSPNISDMLGRIYGSARKSIDDLRFSPNPTALRFLQVYDSLPKDDRERVPLEAICIKSEVSPQEYLGMVFLMRQSLGKAESSLLAVSAFPNVVQDMVKFAAEPSGYADRKMLAQHPAIGFLPNPKGASLSVNLFGGEASFEEDADPEFDGFTEAFSGKNELEEWSKNACSTPCHRVPSQSERRKLERQPVRRRSQL